MKVRQAERASHMLDVVGPSLVAREIENSIVLAVLGRVAAKRERANLLAWVEDDDGRALACAVRTSRPQALVSTGPRSAIEALADDLATTHRELGGVHGSEETADAFAARWCARTGDRSHAGLETTVYVATSVTPPHDPGGAPRLATSADLERLVPWFQAFSIEAHVETDGPAVEMARRHVDAETLWVWAHSDPTCMALATDATTSVSRISWVFTPKEKRARGYGSALVASLTARALARGKRACTLNADVRNATSNGIYTRIGYAPIGAAKTVVFDRALDRS